MDVLAFVLVTFLFGVGFAYIRGCDSLKGTRQ